jgi:hypothetical protein
MALLSLLLLNLVIAMFSKTFDSVAENSVQEYLLQKARLTFFWMRAPNRPPPLSFFAIFSRLGFKILVDVLERIHKKPPPPSPPMEFALPIFDNMHFLRIVFSEWPNEEEKKALLKQNEIFEEEFKLNLENMVSNGALVQKKIKAFQESEFLKYCGPKVELWRKQVLSDCDENSQSNSESQMRKFETCVLRGIDSSNMNIDELKLQHKALLDVVQSQNAQISEILRRINP